VLAAREKASNVADISRTWKSRDLRGKLLILTLPDEPVDPLAPVRIVGPMQLSAAESSGPSPRRSLR
jgi:hypothetical protein